MPSREFVDSKGVRWVAWSTVPASPVGVGDTFGSGWLSFQSPAELRRLAPIPARWLDCPPDRLELMCRAAECVPRHTAPLPLEGEVDPPAPS